MIVDRVCDDCGAATTHAVCDGCGHEHAARAFRDGTFGHPEPWLRVRVNSGLLDRQDRWAVCCSWNCVARWVIRCDARGEGNDG
jgi:hypothetical protein